MDLNARNCPTRKTLEERGWKLVDRLSITAPQLLTSAGVDHKVFNKVSARCHEIRTQLAESHRQLQAHRSEHGC
jgi:hypothetical protein